jgi:2-oxoglutarate dehydrogenase E2 component (dihydrolipoamide succinyltransferase)
MASSLEIRAPAEQTEGTRSQVLRWLKSVGDEVTENEPLIELETDKVTVEVAAPGNGVLREILKHEQEEIEPGAVLGVIEVGASASAARETAAAPAISQRQAQEREPARATTTAERASAAKAPLSPAVRRLLAERGLSPEDVRGTGPGGRITVDDVLAHTAAAAPATPAPSAPAEAVEVPEGFRAVPHSPVRKRIAEHMVQSLLRTAPHVTSVFEADMSAVLVHRAGHRALFEAEGVPLTLTAYLVAAAVDAIRAVPEANSRWTESALLISDRIDMGIATALEDGSLVVPVLRDVGSRDLLSIARGINDLVKRARAGTLTPADVRGGTFTISNHGVSGSLLAAPIVINQPQSAILGVGKLEKRPVVIEDVTGDRIEVRPRCYVTLTIDHRVMDGYHANRFLQAYVSRLENWTS